MKGESGRETVAVVSLWSVWMAVWVWVHSRLCWMISVVAYIRSIHDWIPELLEWRKEYTRVSGWDCHQPSDRWWREWNAWRASMVVCESPWAGRWSHQEKHPLLIRYN